MTLAETVIAQANEWIREGRPVVTATITRVRGSSSQPLGSRMAITTDGEFVGFVSGGCVETDVRDRATMVLADGVPRLLHYSQVTDPVFEVGLNCEGAIEVVLERLPSPGAGNLTPLTGSIPPDSAAVTAYREIRSDDLQAGLQVEHHLVTAANDPPATLPPDIVASARDAATTGRTTSAEHAEWRYLMEPAPRKPLLLIVSVSSVAYPLCRLAATLGYRVVISDPRSEYLSQSAFPQADQLLAVWPRDLPGHLDIGGESIVVSLNHEPRFEDDLFRMLQEQPPVRYLGAIGKRQRHTERIERQKDAGFDLSRLPPIHTPIGLDLGGKSAEEVALSILAEIQAERHGATGAPLVGNGPAMGTDGLACEPGDDR